MLQAPTVTSDRICSPVTDCSANRTWSHVPATYTTDVVCNNAVATCSKASPYVQQPPTSTTNRICVAHCSGLNTAPTRNVAPIGSSCQCAGMYIISEATKTTDRVCGPTCKADQFQTLSSNLPQSDGLLLGRCQMVTNCTNPSAPYQSVAPTYMSNRICVEQCASNHYLAIPQLPGTSSGVCTPVCNCTNSVSGLYQSRSPTLSTDRGCTQGCSSAAYIAKPKVIGTAYGVCVLISNCTTIASGLYQSAPPSATSDRECTVSCDVGQEYVSEAHPPNTSNGVCTQIRNCTTPAQYQVGASTMTTNRLCRGFCSRNEFARRPAHTSTSLGVCTFTTNCTNPTPFEMASPTQSTNRQCTAKCSETEYSHPADGTSGGRCTPLTRCQSSNVQSIAPTSTTDRVCVGRAHDGPSQAAVDGISGGVVATVLLIVLGGWILWRRSKSKRLQLVTQTVELDNLYFRSTTRDAREQRLLAAWQIPEEHLTFIRPLAEGRCPSRSSPICGSSI